MVGRQTANCQGGKQSDRRQENSLSDFNNLNSYTPDFTTWVKMTLLVLPRCCAILCTMHSETGGKTA